jgi:paraquat-inducible protein B
LVGNAKGALQSMHDLSERLDHDLPPLIASLQTTSERSTRAVDIAAGAITDLHGRLDDALTHVTQFVATGDQQMTQRGADLRVLLTSFNQTVQQAHEMLSDLKSLTSSRGESRANLDSTLRDLAAAAAALRGFSNDVEHNPQLLLTGRRP